VTSKLNASPQRTLGAEKILPQQSRLPSKPYLAAIFGALNHNLRNYKVLCKQLAASLPLLPLMTNRLHNLLMPVLKKGYSILPFAPDTYK